MAKNHLRSHVEEYTGTYGAWFSIVLSYCRKGGGAKLWATIQFSLKKWRKYVSLDTFGALPFCLQTQIACKLTLRATPPKAGGRVGHAPLPIFGRSTNPILSQPGDVDYAHSITVRAPPTPLRIWKANDSSAEDAGLRQGGWAAGKSLILKTI